MPEIALRMQIVEFNSVVQILSIIHIKKFLFIYITHLT